MAKTKSYANAVVIIDDRYGDASAYDSIEVLKKELLSGDLSLSPRDRIFTLGAELELQVEHVKVPVTRTKTVVKAVTQKQIKKKGSKQPTVDEFGIPVKKKVSIADVGMAARGGGEVGASKAQSSRYRI
jgi:hypothetical protein